MDEVTAIYADMGFAVAEGPQVGDELAQFLERAGHRPRASARQGA